MPGFPIHHQLPEFTQNHGHQVILRPSDFFIVQLSHPYMTTEKTKAFTRRTFVGKVMSLLLNMLSRLVLTFLSRSKHILVSWLQSPSAVILESKKIKSDTVSTVRTGHGTTDLFQKGKGVCQGCILSPCLFN